MHQRLVIALMKGPAQGSTQALLVPATCPKGFSDEWNATFDCGGRQIIGIGPFS